MKNLKIYIKNVFIYRKTKKIFYHFDFTEITYKFNFFCHFCEILKKTYFENNSILKKGKISETL